MQLFDQSGYFLSVGTDLFLFQPVQLLTKLFKLLALPVSTVQLEGGQVLLAALESLLPES
jgi:hypothetical protein